MKKRTVSFVLAICMLFTMLPSPAFASRDEETGMQYVSLPIIAEGEDAPAPQGLGDSMSLMGLVANTEGCSYMYEGVTEYYLSGGTIKIKDPVTGSYVTDDSTLDREGVLQMLDSNGNVLTTSLAISYYNSETDSGYDENGNWYRNTLYYYIRYATFEGDELPDIPAGTYSLQLVDGNTTYPCEGSIVVVSSDDLLISSAYASNMHIGQSTFELDLCLYGFETEEELSALTFELYDANGILVGSSSGQFRDISSNNYYGAVRWDLYTQITMNDGLFLQQNAEYSIKICYSGEKDLYDGVGAITREAYTPSVCLVDFSVVDPLTSLVQISVEHWTAATIYHITVTTSINNTSVVVGKYSGTIPDDGIVEMTLSPSGSVTPASALGYNFGVAIDSDSGSSLDTVSFSNPYYGLSSSSGNGWFTPYCVSTTDTELNFTLELNNFSAYTGENDVLTVQDEDGNEVARCTQLTKIPLADSSYTMLSGTLTFDPALEDAYYYVFLNGTEVDSFYATADLLLSRSIPFISYDSSTDTDSFYTNFGVFPVSVCGINSSGTGTLVIKDGNDNVALSSPTLTGTTGEYDGFLYYNYIFTAEEIATLDQETEYYLWYEDPTVGRPAGFTIGYYNAEKVYLDPSCIYDHYYISLYNNYAGDTTVGVGLYTSNNDGVKNLTSEDLASLYDLVFTHSDTSTQSKVTGIKEIGYTNDDYYCYSLELTLNQPLSAGRYTVYYNDTSVNSYWVSEAEDEITLPTLYNRDYDSTEGYICGEYLPEDGVYTARLYSGYTCLTETAFSLTLETYERQSYLYYPSSAVADLDEGDYELRVYLNGAILDSVTLTVAPDGQLIVEIQDCDTYVNTQIVYSNYVLLRVYNSGLFTKMRVAESQEALSETSYRAHNGNYYFPLSEGEGEWTLYAQLQTADGSDETEIYTLKFWRMASDDLLNIFVSDDLQGIYSGNSIQFFLGSDCMYGIPVMEMENADGECVTIPLGYAGLGELPALYPEAILESSHPYANNEDKTWPSYTIEGAASLNVTFSGDTMTESYYDYIYVYAGSAEEENLVGKYHGNQLSGVTLTIPGDTVTIRLTSDSSATYYGFAITSIVDPNAEATEDDENSENYIHLYSSKVYTNLTSSYSNHISNGVYLSECELIRFYLMDEDSNVISEVVERMLIFGNPDSVILPQFRDYYNIPYFNTGSVTIYGYATPNSTVTYSDYSGNTLATVTANNYGYFTAELELEDGYYTIIVADDSGVTASSTASFQVDTVAPTIESIQFTFSENNVATIRWVCNDSDVEYFHILKNTTLLDRYVDSDSRTYNVAASYDDGNFFTIRAVDYAGNIGERTVSTADQEPPTAPEQLTVTAVTTTSVTLEWTAGTDNVGILGYDIYMDGREALRLATDGDTLSYTVTGLEPGQEYTFTVKSRDKAGNTSDPSPAATATTVSLTVAPEMNSSYVVDLYPSKVIPVAYTVTSDTEGYTPVVQTAYLDFRTTGSADDWTTQTLSSGGSGSWNIAGDDEDGYLPKGSYDVRIRVIDTNGAEVASDPVLVVVLSVDAEAPSAPGLPTADSHSTTSITFHWDAATDNVGVTGYEVWRDGEKVADVTAASYTDSGLTMGTAYTYQIIAVDGRGNRSAASSASLSTMTLAFQSVYSFDSSYVLEAQYGKTIEIWATFRPEEGYAPEVTMAVEFKAPGSDQWQTRTMTCSDDDVNHFTYLVNGNLLEPFALGSYEVRFSVTDGSATAYSDIQTVELKPETEAPTVSISPTSGTYGGAAIKLTAVAVDNVAVSRIVFSYAPSGADTFTELGSVATTGTASYTWDASALDSGSYTIRAQAYDLRDNMGEITATITVDNTPPDVPSGLTATATSRYIHLMWATDYKPSADFRSFRIYRSTSSGGIYELQAELSSIGYYDDSETAEDGVTYYYYVTAVDDYGNESEPSAIISATFILDTQSPTISDMLPEANKGLRKEVTLRVIAYDNYRLSTAVFSYRLKGTESWIEIGRDEVDSITDSHAFSLLWNIPASLDGEYELRAEVYDDSINTVDSGYTANAPAVITRTVNLHPYYTPVAPSVTAVEDYKSAELSWTYSTNEDLLDTLKHFLVYRTDASGGSAQRVATVAAGETGSCTVTLALDTTEYFVVVAVDDYGITASSSVIAVNSLPGETVPPVAVMLPETLAAAVGVPFDFSGVNSTDNDVIASYAWNFGDGTTGSGATCSHTYAAAGSYTVTLTVTDSCGNSGQVSAPITVYDVSSEDASHALVTLHVVNAYEVNTPGISGANIKVYVQDTDGNTTFETSAVTDANGDVTLVAPLGQVTVAATAEGYVATSRAVTVEPDDSGRFEYTVGMTMMNVSLVDGSLSFSEMTYDEIISAGIDVTDPDNNHVWKFAATLEFVAGPALPFDLPDLDLTGFFDSNGFFLGGTGWGWNFLGGSGGGSGSTGWGMNVGVFPISEHFILVIYGEAHWLKEMYNVELLVINNSYVDDITDCLATLDLPEGLSLAAMTGSAQNATINIGTIPHKTAEDTGANTAKANWYVRGDKEGEYNLTATVTGSNPDPFVKTFTTDRPLKVYAGSALKLFITAEDIAYNGEEYCVQFKLQNVSDKDLYNLSFGLTGAEQFRVLTLGENEYTTELTHEDFGDSMTYAVDVLHPGGSITIDFYTTSWFYSMLELVDMGPFDVGYYLTNVFVTTLEGSTTTIPYEVSIVRSSHGSFYEWLLEEGKSALDGEIISIIEEELLEEVPLISKGKKLYDFISKSQGGDAASRCEITLDNGYFTTSDNYIKPLSVQNGAISVYTDGDYEISADGKTMTITGDASIYVEGEQAGNATMTVVTYVMDGEEAIPHTYTVKYTVDGEAGEAEDLVLQTPVVGTEDGVAAIPLYGSTTEITFPYILVAEDGSYQTCADNAQWAVTGEDTTGLSFRDGILTVESIARAGTYTVTLTVGEKTASQTITLTREPPVVTRIEICRSNTVVEETDTLILSAEDITYTARVIDQYGVPFDHEVVWTVTENTIGASMSGGVLTLDSSCTAGQLTLTATDKGTGISDSITVAAVAKDSIRVVWSNMTDTSATATLYVDADVTIALQFLVAAYDTNGKMVDCAFVSGSLDDSGCLVLHLNFTAADNVASIQAFVLNVNTYEPLTSVWDSDN